MPARKSPVGCVDRGFDSYGSDGSGALEDLIRVVGVAELAVVHPPIATGADKIAGDEPRKHVWRVLPLLLAEAMELR
jgi:hypothetical protein